MIRRGLILAALATLLLAVAAPAGAQVIVGPIGPGGLVFSSTAAVSASTQVATAQTLFSKSVAPSLMNNNRGHLSLKGYLGTAQSSAGTLGIACSYGSISLTIFSGFSLTTALQNVPISVDLWILPTTTGGLAKELQGRVTHVASGTTVIWQEARTTGTLTSANNQTLACTATFSDTTIATGIIVQNAALGITL